MSYHCVRTPTRGECVKRVPRGSRGLSFGSMGSGRPRL